MEVSFISGILSYSSSENTKTGWESFNHSHWSVISSSTVSVSIPNEFRHQEYFPRLVYEKRRDRNWDDRWRKPSWGKTGKQHRFSFALVDIMCHWGFISGLQICWIGAVYPSSDHAQNRGPLAAHFLLPQATELQKTSSHFQVFHAACKSNRFIIQFCKYLTFLSLNCSLRLHIKKPSALFYICVSFPFCYL